MEIRSHWRLKAAATGTPSYAMTELSSQNKEHNVRPFPFRFQYHFWLYVLSMILTCVIAPERNDLTAAEGARDMTVYRTPENIPFGVIGELKKGNGPAPTLFVIAHGFEEMRKQPVYTEIAVLMAKQGFISIVVEPPCHGEDIRPGEPPQIEGWRYRLEHDCELISPFVVKVQSVLDLLIREGTTDPQRVAVCGTSRGGWLTFHDAAVEPRFKAAAAISPVTNLTALREFATTTARERVEQLNLARLAPKLAGRAIWLSIGNNDARVNPDEAIAFTREVVRTAALAEAPDTVIPVELLVAPTAGHAKIDKAHEMLAEWLIKRMPPEK